MTDQTTVDDVLGSHLEGTVTDIRNAKARQQRRQSPTEKPKKPSPADVSEEFHDYCLSKSRKFVFWRGSYYLYTGKKYVEYQQQDIEIAIAAFLRHHPEARDYITVGFMTATEKVFRSIVKLDSRIEENTFISGKLKGEQLLALDNGILCLYKQIKRDPDCLLQHTPDFFSVTCLPYPYIPGSVSQPLQDFLNTSVPDLKKQDFLQEWSGLNLTHRVCETLVILQGEGANGKSVYGMLLKMLLGQGNYSAVQPEDLSRDDKVLSLLGMRANICDDMNENVPLKFGTIKALTSGSDQTVSRKYKIALTFAPTAKHTWICNHFPNITDRSEGTMRRLVPMTFDYVIPVEQRNPNLKLESWWIEHGNMSGVLNWALEGLRRLADRGWRFDIPEDILDLRESIRVDSQPELQFFEECLEFGSGEGFVSGTGILHEAYLRWMKGSKSAMKQSTFVRAMRKRFPELSYNNNPTTNRAWYGRQRSFVGVRLALMPGNSARPQAVAHDIPSLDISSVQQEKIIEETSAKLNTLEKTVRSQAEVQADIGNALHAMSMVFIRMLAEAGITLSEEDFRSRVLEAMGPAPYSN